MGRASRAKKDRIDQGGLPDYFHGGAPGLSVGDVLIPGKYFPAHVAHVQRVPQQFKVPGMLEFVHITPNSDLAFDYAWVRAGYPDGAGSVYRVRPIGRLSIDPDYKHVEGVSMRCRQAEILEVVIPVVTRDRDSTHTADRLRTWDDGTPIYSEDGYGLPPSVAQVLGMHPSRYRSLGRWPSEESINLRSQELAAELHPGADDAELRQRYLAAISSGMIPPI